MCWKVGAGDGWDFGRMARSWLSVFSSGSNWSIPSKLPTSQPTRNPCLKGDGSRDLLDYLYPKYTIRLRFRSTRVDYHNHLSPTEISIPYNRKTHDSPISHIVPSLPGSYQHTLRPHNLHHARAPARPRLPPLPPY